jgi:hypothetical protein
MKKLYLATLPITAVYASFEKDKEEAGVEFLRREIEENTLPMKGSFAGRDQLEIIEITCEQDLPEEWRRGPCIWGVSPDVEITAEQFLAEQSQEYQEYRRLKAKYEQ